MQLAAVADLRRQRVALENDLALALRQKAGDDPGQRRLVRAVLADHRHRLAAGPLQADVVQALELIRAIGRASCRYTSCQCVYVPVFTVSLTTNSPHTSSHSLTHT